MISEQKPDEFQIKKQHIHSSIKKLKNSLQRMIDQASQDLGVDLLAKVQTQKEQEAKASI